MYAPLANSHRDANKLKTDEDVTVVLGNPPYRTRAKLYGKWTLDRNPGQLSPLDDFRAPGNGVHEHKLHDLAIYFWRWSLWKVFESTPDQPTGVIAFITTYAYLSGPGFAGMRQYLRQQADFGWIIDLSTEGHWSSVQTRVFPGVPHPVCIGVFARRSEPRRDRPASIQYLAVSGSQAEKFSRLKPIHIDSLAWRDCPAEWTAPLRPIQDSAWMRHPSIDDLLPYTSLGLKCNRTWVHAPDPDILMKRWRVLARSDPEKKRLLMKETRDRTIDKAIPPFPGSSIGVTIRNEKSVKPRIEPIGFRSFDRQYLIADQRVVDFLRPDLWKIRGSRQVYLVTQTRESLTNGPAAVFTADVPDTHYFKGHHGGRTIPLYRDKNRTLPNVAPKLLPLLGQRLGLQVENEDMMAYVAGVIAHSGYTKRFRDELQQPGVRVPLTAEPELWREAIRLGKQIIWLHTFGERFDDDAEGRPLGQPSVGRPGVVGSIPGSAENIPESITYEDASRSLVLGPARIEPVSPAVAAYEVSGMRIIKHWFDYRRRNPAGRRGGSELEEMTAESWTLAMTEQLRDIVAVLEGCVKLEAQQADLLDRIVAGPLITTADLEEASVLPPPPGARHIVEDDADSALFKRSEVQSP